MIQLPLGFALTQIDLPSHLRERVVQRNWNELDQAIRAETLPGGVIFEKLLEYAKFSEIEFIISIRSSLHEPDEDGIWHDDGSRLLAFSLSLTLDHEKIQGGKLQLRKSFTEGATMKEISTPTYGTIIVFATGQLGFEHKINCVTQGERIIIAGWCT